MNEYTFYWRDGQKDVGTGNTPAEALSALGYGAGALSALDFYAETGDYEWDSTVRSWTAVK